MNAMEYWQNDLKTKASGTQLKYQELFQQFLKYINQTPDQLIEQRRIDLKADDPRTAKTCENYLKAFITKLRDDGYSPATQQIAYAAIKSFFESNEYPLRMKRTDYPQGESLGVRAITKPLIREILEDTKHMKFKLKTQALILCAKDTGQGVTELGNLTYGHVRKGLEANDDFIMLHLIRQKTRTIAKPILGPESIAALKLYLEERQKGTRRIPPEKLTDKSPLFRTTRADKVERISRSGLSGILRFQCTKTGQVDLSAHSFRKYLQTSLDVAGVSPNIIDRIIGHKLGGSRDPYSQPTDEDLLNAYKSAYPQIRIFPDKQEMNQRFDELEKQLSEKTQIIASLTVETSKFTVLKQEFDRLNSLVASLVESREAQVSKYRSDIEFNRRRLASDKGKQAIAGRIVITDLEARAQTLEEEIAELKAKIKTLKM